ncbi:hypothetical protein HQN89_11020 [Paenibacillus frigoriresistens]|uniref:hypothetical protein n=1 Tax=Paenibacillus alginolyticus TaxID=59839 RepID=UPI0015671D8C|nr:hypothetical protein [Paenibacillus frigoriresistens]NRF91551.1 hypothetical protein [Paenibacillus frigoriresistens]
MNEETTKVLSVLSNETARTIHQIAILTNLTEIAVLKVVNDLSERDIVNFITSKSDDGLVKIPSYFLRKQ